MVMLEAFWNILQQHSSLNVYGRRTRLISFAEIRRACSRKDTIKEARGAWYGLRY